MIFLLNVYDINNYYNYKYHIDSIICGDCKNSRIKKLEEFNNSYEISILCSVCILDECIDIPSCDSIYITYNCVSKIRIIQRISRDLRKNNNKIAKILIWCENINTLNPIISVIKEIDNDIIKKIKYISYNKKLLLLNEQHNIQKYNIKKNNNELHNIYYQKNDNYDENLKIFINKFYKNIKEFNLHINENIDLVINFDNLVNWLNMRKDNLKKTLIASYIKNIDYKIQKIKSTSVGKPKEEILITIDCCKRLCLSSRTKKADEIRKSL